MNRIDLAMQVFISVYNGSVDLVTPEIEAYYLMNNNLVVELSSGKGIENILYGVTVLYINPVLGKAYKTEYNRPFFSRKNALSYIESLANIKAPKYNESQYRFLPNWLVNELQAVLNPA